jgi:hypothetical protein
MKPAQAHVIDRIDINRVGDEAEIHIQFDVRIQYLREASLKNGEIHVFIQLLEADPDSASLLRKPRIRHRRISPRIFRLIIPDSIPRSPSNSTMR